MNEWLLSGRSRVNLRFDACVSSNDCAKHKMNEGVTISSPKIYIQAL